MKARILLLLLTLGVIVVVAGCGSDESTSPGFGSVRVSMTDAPGDYDQVNIVIREVRVHQTGENDADSHWLVVRPDSASTYDLLTLRNGVFVTLGFARGIPSGAYDQVRLVLGAGSNVVVDGVSHPLVPGTSCFLGYDVKHELINESPDQDLVMLWVITPPGLEDFFKAIGRPREAGQPAPAPFERPADVIAIERRMGMNDTK